MLADGGAPAAPEVGEGGAERAQVHLHEGPHRALPRGAIAGGSQCRRAVLPHPLVGFATTYFRRPAPQAAGATSCPSDSRTQSRALWPEPPRVRPQSRPVRAAPPAGSLPQCIQVFLHRSSCPSIWIFPRKVHWYVPSAVRAAFMVCFDVCAICIRALKMFMSHIFGAGSRSLSIAMHSPSRLSLHLRSTPQPSLYRCMPEPGRACARAFTSRDFLISSGVVIPSTIVTSVPRSACSHPQ